VAVDVVDLYIRSVASFGEALTKVGLDEWQKPTPCPDWDMQSLSVHVVSGEVQLVELVESGIVMDQEMDSGVLGSDPVATWRGAAIRAITIARSTPLDTELPHPKADLTFESLLGARITENAVHAWDLSQALSLPCAVEDDIAGWLLDYWLPLFDFISDSEHFSSPVQPIDDTPSARLLGLLGRNQKN